MKNQAPLTGIILYNYIYIIIKVKNHGPLTNSLLLQDPGTPLSIPGMLPPINTNHMPPTGDVYMVSFLK